MICWPFGPVYKISWLLSPRGRDFYAVVLFLVAVNSAKVPDTGIFFLLRPTGTGLLLAFSRWSVLPGFSVSSKDMLERVSYDGTYMIGTAWRRAAPTRSPRS